MFEAYTMNQKLYSWLATQSGQMLTLPLSLLYFLWIMGWDLPLKEEHSPTVNERKYTIADKEFWHLATFSASQFWDKKLLDQAPVQSGLKAPVSYFGCQ